MSGTMSSCCLQSYPEVPTVRSTNVWDLSEFRCKEEWGEKRELETLHLWCCPMLLLRKKKRNDRRHSGRPIDWLKEKSLRFLWPICAFSSILIARWPAWKKHAWGLSGLWRHVPKRDRIGELNFYLSYVQWRQARRKRFPNRLRCIGRKKVFFFIFLVAVLTQRWRGHDCKRNFEGEFMGNGSVL